VKVARELGASVNAANHAGETAPHGAAAQNYPLVAQYLIDHGAWLDARKAKGKTPLDVASGDAVAALLKKLR
jgi:ankyrin repeat protein